MPPINVATITVDDQTITVDVALLQTGPDSHIVFVVRNIGSRKRKVTIDRGKFQKTQDSNPPGPDTPITFFGRHSEDVDPGDADALVLRIKDKDDFGGAPANRYYKYKYTIEASGLQPLDPDIGIDN
jgi:hypothetical protein